MRHNFPSKALVCALIVIISLVAAGCDGSPSPTPNSATAITQIPANCTPTGTPSISISPRHGKAGTRVSIVGGGFPAGCTVQVRLGTQEKGTTSEVYATAEVAQHGNVQTSFVMPDRWPSGEAITFPEILVVVTTPDFLEKAVTPFGYEAFGTPNVTPTTEGQISNLQCCPAPEAPTVKQPSSQQPNKYLDPLPSDFAN